MPTIRRPGSAPSDPHAPLPAAPTGAGAPEEGAPAEHSLLALHVPEDTTPTWELEMLVSGAVLVGLFQLPPVVDGVWRAAVPRLPSQLASIAGALAFVYVKGMIYALMVAFVVHLASRAYWVALVGLDSVFPLGVRWEQARYGPVTEGLLRAKLPPLPRMISAIDNFCSVVFAVGFVAVFIGLLGLIVVGLASLAAWGISAAFLHGAYGDKIMPLLVWVVLAPALAMAVDRRVGRRLHPDGRPAAVIQGLVRFSHAALGLRFYGPILLTLTTNVRRRVARPIVMLLLFGSMGFAFTDMLAIRGTTTAAMDPGLPEALRPRAVDFRHYADQRSGNDAFTAVPFIQSDVVHDPYVRLFIPYRVSPDGRELVACLRGPAAADGAAHAVSPGDAGQRAIDCLAAIHAVVLDGRARSDLDHRFYTDAASGLQGLLVYIPVEGLPHGRHLITVRRPPQPDDEGRLRAATADSIPFWL